jgi:Flp pilus assembly protein TadG
MKRSQGRRGTASFEFCFGAPLLLAAFFGTFEIGYTLVQYDRLETAVALAAHYAALIPYDSATSTPSSAFLGSVKNMVLYGTPTTGNTPVVSGLTTTNVSLVVTFASGIPSTMQVSITGYTINALFGVFSLNGKLQATFPYQGVWAPA